MEQIKRLKQETSPRSISKKVDPQGRTELAGNILGIRSEKRLAKTNIKEHENKIEEYDQSKEDMWKTKESKEQELEKRQEKIIVKLKNLLGLRDKKIAALRIAIELNSSARRKLFDEAQKTENKHKSLQKNISDMPNPADLLSAYYEKISTEPLDHEQKSELLDAETLSQLTEDEYIALWKRLNPHFVSHVTRQGFRDHVAMNFHLDGMHEFADGLVDILKDEKSLRPPLAVREGLRSRDAASIEKWLNGWVLKAETKEEAEERLNDTLYHSLAEAPKYPDKTAVHFANETVANGWYGGEMDNEVFIIYPSDFIASQHSYYFNGFENDFTKPQSDAMWNDVFVWPPNIENPGITVDAGIVFLPNKTPVDPDTGSRYAHENVTIDGKEKRVMIEDKTLVEAFIEWLKQSQSRVREVCEAYDEELNSYGAHQRRLEIWKKYLSVFAEELMNIGFKPDDAGRLIDKIVWSFANVSPENFNEERMRKIVRSTRANWKRAEKTIAAREYWENFFQKNFQLRPEHIEYYDGDPTNAVYAFQRKNNIGKADTSERDGVLLGFDKNNIPTKEAVLNDSRANPGLSELVNTAKKVIREYYK